MRGFSLPFLFAVLLGLTSAAPRAASLISDEMATGVLGGACEPDSFVNCRRAKMGSGTTGCGACVDSTKCEADELDEVCTALTGTTAEDCIKCGACPEDCDGGSATYEESDCTGDIILTGTCISSWINAVNGSCSVACP